MEDYRSRQRQRWTGSAPVQQTPRTVSPPPAQPAVDGVLSKIHILPVMAGEEMTISEDDRLAAVLVELERSVAAKQILVSGHTFANARGQRFVVARTEPEEGGLVVPSTDFFVNGPPVVVLKRLQLVALRDPSPSGESADNISDALFRDSLSPFIQSRVSENGSKILPVFAHQTIHVGSERFVVTAMDPMPASDGLGAVDINTLTYVDAEQSGDYERIHVLPFQDTLPRVYDFDIFEDYLKPFFTMNPLALYSVNTQFAFHGVQFKVVCVDPSDSRPRRIGPGTVIHCEGLLHATLRNMLPPELLEQLSSLPPGLQMLLINTELLASADVLDRFIDLQETLAARRGVSQEVLDSLPVESYKRPETETDRPESASQCMICLSDFEDGELLRRLPCTHVFHKVCIDEWLLHRSTSCCLCKADVDRAVRR